MEKYDRGSLISVETSVKKSEPYGADADYSPTSVKLTIKDNNEVVKVDGVDMVEDSTGKYFYKVQSVADWSKGQYQSTITVVDGGDSDTTVEDIFYLE